MWSYRILLVATVAAAASGAAHPHAALRDAAAAPAPPQLKVVQPRDLGGGGEPTCEELKAMWRFSKRQARAPEIMNEISTYRDPFTYNEWTPYYSQTPRFRGSTRGWSTGVPRYTVPKNAVYGNVVVKAPLSRPGGASSPFDQVASVYGVLQPDETSMSKSQNGATVRMGGAGRAPSQRIQHYGKFNQLKELVRIERARELQAQVDAEKLAARRAAEYRSSIGRPDDYQRYYSRGSQNMDSLQEDSPSADEPAPAPRQGYTNRHRQQQPVTGYLRHSNHDNSKYPEMTFRERRADLLAELDDLAFYHQPWDLAYEGGNFAPAYGEGSYEIPNYLMLKGANMNLPEHFKTEESG